MHPSIHQMRFWVCGLSWEIGGMCRNCTSGYMHKGVPLQHAGDKKSAKEVQYLIRSGEGGRWSCSHSVQPACTNHTTLPSSGQALRIQIINFEKNILTNSPQQYHIRYSVLHCMRSMWVLPLASGSLQSVHKLQLQFHLAMQRALEALEALLMH